MEEHEPNAKRRADRRRVQDLPEKLIFLADHSVPRGKHRLSNQAFAEACGQSESWLKSAKDRGRRTLSLDADVEVKLAELCGFDPNWPEWASGSAASFRDRYLRELGPKDSNATGLTAEGLAAADHRQPILKQKWSADQSDDTEFERDRFLYSARSIPLIGRDDELAQIEAFLTDPSRRFSWMILYGPGGVGKSRLALEVILKPRGGTWNAGFLDERHAGPDWSVWQPHLPTFMVIDYAASAADKVALLIAALAEREAAHQLQRPVRLLLLERQAEGPWLDRILALSRKGRNCRGADLALGTPSSLWPIFQHVWRWRKPGANLPDEQETLSRFAELDPQQRPLFAMLMADAIARHGRDRQWSREALLEDVLLRERQKFWRPAAAARGLDPQHIEKEERALALATMTGGLSADALADDDNAGLLPHWDRDQHPKLFRAMSGFTNRTIRPLEPDLVGEFFVLTLLDADPDAARPLVERAWHTEPFEVEAFVTRCALDFGNLPALASTYRTPLRDGRAREVWTALAVNLIIVFRADDLAAARGLYDELRALADAHPSESQLRLRQALAAVNLVAHIGDVDLAAARALYDELRVLADAHPSEPELRLRQAQVAFTLIGKLRADDLAVARGLYDELRALADAHPDEADLRLEQAKAAGNMIHNHLSADDHAVDLIVHLRADDLAVARGLYDELRALADAHPSEPELRLRQAGAAVDLIFRLDLAAARALYAEQRALATDHPGEPGLRVQQAKAAFNLFNLLVADDLAAARGLYDELRALADAHPDEPGLRYWRVQVAVDLIAHLGASDLAAARACFDELRALATDHPGEPGLRLWQGRTAYILICRLVSGDLAAARVLYAELQALAASHPDEPDPRRAQAEAAVSLVNSLVADDPAAARVLYEELRALAAAHPGQADLRIPRAKAAFILIRGVDDPVAARALWADPAQRLRRPSRRS